MPTSPPGQTTFSTRNTTTDLIEGRIVDLTGAARRWGIEPRMFATASAFRTITHGRARTLEDAPEGAVAFCLALVHELALVQSLDAVHFTKVAVQIDAAMVTTPLSAVRERDENGAPILTIMLRDEALARLTDSADVLNDASIVRTLPRAAMLASGALIDLSDFAKMIGLDLPIYITANALRDATGHDPTRGPIPEKIGVTLLACLGMAAPVETSNGIRLDFLAIHKHKGRAVLVPLYGLMVPEPDGRPSITIMRSDEE